METVEVFCINLLGYVLLIVGTQFFRVTLFQLYLLVHRKSPEERITLYEKLDDALKACITNSTAPPDPNRTIEKRLQRITYGSALAWGGFFILMIIAGLYYPVSAIRFADNLSETGVGVFWLTVSSITVIHSLLFWFRLNKLDSSHSNS